MLFEKCCQLSFHSPQMLWKEETIIHMDLTDNLGAGESSDGKVPFYKHKNPGSIPIARYKK